MSASSDTQFGFNFETERELIATSVEEAEQPCPDCDGSAELCSNVECERYRSPMEVSSQTFLLPELEEEAKQREENKEPEIPWTEYTRMVQLFFNEPQNEEFRELTSKLAVLYGTKSVTDTVAEAMRNAALRSKV